MAASASPTDTVHLVPVNHTWNGNEVVLACELVFGFVEHHAPGVQGDYVGAMPAQALRTQEASSR